MVKFRGKSVISDTIVEGYYCKVIESHIIKVCVESSYNNKYEEFDIIVHKDSIAMSTGLFDSEKNEVFGSIEIEGKMSDGGDVLKSSEFNMLLDWKVCFRNGRFGVENIMKEVTNRTFYPVDGSEYYFINRTIIKG